MGGFGSGRIGGLSSRPTCESCHHIDLAWLRRQGMLSVGRCSTVRWSRSGQETGSISLTAQEYGLHLRYSTTDDRGAPLTVSELIPFTYTGAGFGGRRGWLKCLSCGRGCRVIYGGRYFRCRLCHGLAYKSQIEPDYDRALEQATRIGVRLGDNPSMLTRTHTLVLSIEEHALCCECINHPRETFYAIT